MYVQHEQTTLQTSLPPRAETPDEAMIRGAGRLPEAEEDLIADQRANLGPAELVEDKLRSLLRSALLPVSHVRMAALGGRRRPCCG
jgi:hypothetical protein